MILIRGFAVWLGAAFLGAMICTLVWSTTAGWVALGWRMPLVIAGASLIYTIAGSALLSCLFAGMKTRSTTYRYLVLVVVGGVAGGVLMLISGAAPGGIVVGAAYGFVTACFWVTLHGAMNRPQTAC